MLENFIYAKQKSLFEEALNNGEVLNEAIVFIEDTKEIWNHGTYFDCSSVDLSNIEASIQNIIDTYATKTEIPTKLSQLENDINAWSVIMTAGLCWDNGDFILFDNNEKII